MRLPLALAVTCALTTGSAWADSGNLDAVLNAAPAVASSGPDAISYVRQQALKMAADVLGAQAGYADRCAQIEAIVHAESGSLDAAYPFNALMMGVGVLPPVIVETRDAIALDTQIMRVADRTYKIVVPPRFVAVPPSWRDYLTIGLDTTQPTMPTDAAQLPKTAAERGYWKAQVRKAYARGVAQANAVFDQDLARLKRDYSGMRLFYALYARGMVTAPVIASTHDVMRRDRPGEISLGDSTFRITVSPDFTGPRAWNPIAPLDVSPAQGE